MATEKPTPAAVSDALLKARDLMNNKGKHWIKGRLRRKNEDGETCFCSDGAIREACKGNPKLAAAVRKALVNELNVPAWSRWGDKRSLVQRIVNWNDSAARTWSEVSKAFKSAAKKTLKEEK